MDRQLPHSNGFMSDFEPLYLFTRRCVSHSKSALGSYTISRRVSCQFIILAIYKYSIAQYKGISNSINTEPSRPNRAQMHVS